MSRVRDTQFRKGDRVESTALAIENGVFRCPRRGVVVGWSRKIPYLVRVRCDGLKHPTAYHEDFWQPLTEAKP